MSNRHLCAVCLAWLLSLELRWWRSCSSVASMTQNVTVRVCGHRCVACACAIQSPAPPPRPPAK